MLKIITDSDNIQKRVIRNMVPTGEEIRRFVNVGGHEAKGIRLTRRKQIQAPL